MEGADQILAVAGIDRGLAADRRIDLGEQRGRHLHVIETAAHHGGGEAREIADDAAAERDDEIATLDAGGDQCLADRLEHREALRAFARRHHDGRRLQSRALERGERRREVQLRHRLVADDGCLGARPQRGDPSAERCDEAATDDDLVAARVERDVDHDRITGAQGCGHDARSPPADGLGGSHRTSIWAASPLTISSTIFSCGTSRDCTVTSARA